MPKFTIEICTDNAAFEDEGIATETGRILREVADRIEYGTLPPFTVNDINGKKVCTVDDAGN